MGLNGHIFDCNKMVYCLYNNDWGRQREDKKYDEKLTFLYNEFTDAEIFIVFDNNRPNISSNNHKNFTCSYVYVQYLMND